MSTSATPLADRLDAGWRGTLRWMVGTRSGRRAALNLDARGGHNRGGVPFCLKPLDRLHRMTSISLVPGVWNRLLTGAVVPLVPVFAIASVLAAAVAAVTTWAPARMLHGVAKLSAARRRAGSALRPHNVIGPGLRPGQRYLDRTQATVAEHGHPVMRVYQPLAARPTATQMSPGRWNSSGTVQRDTGRGGLE